MTDKECGMNEAFRRKTCLLQGTCGACVSTEQQTCRLTSRTGSEPAPGSISGIIISEIFHVKPFFSPYLTVAKILKTGGS